MSSSEMSDSGEAKIFCPAKPTPPKDPPRFKWRRPLLHGHKCTNNLYVRDTIVGKVLCVLKEKCGEEALSRFRSGCFGPLLGLSKRADSANIALYELLARELEDTSFGPHNRWFHIGGTDIRFSANEYVLVTGLNFKTSSFDPNVFHEIPANGIYRTHFKGRTRVSTLLEAFQCNRLGNDIEDYLKAAHLLFFYHLLCRGDVWIEDWAWALVEDMASWEIFPWGAYSFRCLCDSFDVLPLKPEHIKNYRRAYHFRGPVWAFQIWAYEAIPQLGNLCGRRDPDPWIPRCLMWSTHVSHADYTTLYDNELMAHAELIPTALEAATVYMSSLKKDPLDTELVCSTDPSISTTAVFVCSIAMMSCYLMENTKPVVWPVDTFSGNHAYKSG